MTHGLGFSDLWTTKVEAQICDLLNESGLWMRVGYEFIWTTKIKGKFCDLLDESDIRIPEMRYETIWVTKVEAQICDLLTEVAFGCVWVVNSYELQKLKHKFVIC